MNSITIKSSGVLAEVTVHKGIAKVYKRNGGRKSNIAKLNSNPSEEELQQQAATKEKSIGDTLRKFNRLVFANFSSGYTLVTLTFDEANCDFDVRDTNTCRTKFTNFWKNLKRGTKEDERLANHINVRYLGAQEFHEDGSIHFHILCHIPQQYDELLQHKWQHGYLDFERSNGSPLDVRRIANYLKKGMRDERLNNGRPRYLASRGLVQTKVFTFIGKGRPTWINESNSDLIYNEDSDYAFQHYKYITSLNEDDLQAYIESANENELQYLMQQMHMIQQLSETI